MKEPLSIEESRNDFDSFLKENENDRVIFSGIFGIGKTFFLNQFFTNHSDYLPIHIFPTNYSVTKNEDIFELIKYDILYKILGHKPDLDKLKA